MDNPIPVSPLSVTVAIVCSVLLVGYYYYENRYSYWSKKGVKGPMPVPVFGNFLQIISGDQQARERDNIQKYGKVYGIYMGATPFLVIADPEVLNQICVKDFDVFPNHIPTEFSNEIQKHFLFKLQDGHWKRARALMSPTFTSGKIKRMFRFLDGCADDLVKCFREQLPVKGSYDQQVSVVVNAKDLYSLFAMDAITTCCYGLKLERAGTASLKTAATRDDFVRVALKLFEFRVFRFLISVIIPKPILRFLKYTITPASDLEPLVQRVTQLVKGRRSSAKKFDDYLQLLVDAKLDDKLELGEMDLEENHHAGLTHKSLLDDQEKMVIELKMKEGDIDAGTVGGKTTLSDMDVLSGGIFLLAVGLETTGSLLTLCTYALAFHQHVQSKLYDELIKIVEYNGDKSKITFDYEALTSCKYLDAVISETFRNLTPVFRSDRMSNSDYCIEKYNISLPAGSRVFFSYHALMNDPDYWEEPRKFDPERFMPGKREKIAPGSYCPFGIGPRHCIGMRFSLTESKLALAKIMVNFRFEPAPDTSFPPETKRNLGLYNFKKPLVSIIPRNSD